LRRIAVNTPLLLTRRLAVALGFRVRTLRQATQGQLP
jgi:hypothetical protein